MARTVWAIKCCTSYQLPRARPMCTTSPDAYHEICRCSQVCYKRYVKTPHHVLRCYSVR